MANKSGERRLLFDTRGRRKHVIRVVYAILALLMGASLFLVVGPVNIGSLLGNSTSGGSAAGVFHEQSERLEQRLAQEPDNEQLLLSLTRARINAGNAQIEVGSETELPTIPPAAHEDFDAASEAWSRYLKQAGDEVNASAAQLVAGTFFRLAESSAVPAEVVSSIEKAAQAQQIAAKERPNIGSLSTLAIYSYFNGDFAIADKATKQAAAHASSNAEAKSIEKQLAEYRKRGKEFTKRKQQVAKVQKELNKEQLKNAFGGTFGGAAAGSPGE